jgi:hypothetical protein
MQTNPDENNSQDQTTDGQPPGIGPQVGERGEIEQSTTQQDARADPQSPPVVKDRLIVRCYRWSKRQFWDSWRFDDRPSFFDALTSLVAVVGVYFLIGQARQTDDALKEAREANRISREMMIRSDADSKQQDVRYLEQVQVARDSASAAKDTATATIGQLAIASDQLASQREAMRLERRAWVTVSGVEFLNKWEPGESLTVRLMIHNSGQSPALNLRVRNRLGYTPQLPAGTRVPSPSPDQIVDSDGSVMVIGPSQIWSNVKPSKSTITKANIQSVIDSKMRFYVFGEIVYDDIFGADHLTEYCFWSSIKDSGPCEKWNTAN